jgi:hypothetical protein
VDLSHSHVVVVEDDMTFAPDFAIYFEQLAHLLDMCALLPTQHFNY